MARAGNISKKLAVLNVIFDQKAILFSDVAHKKEIEVAWGEVLEKAQSVGLAGDSRKWNYARTLFETWKAETLKKVENDSKANKRTPTKLNDVDKLIMDILETENQTPMEYEDTSTISDVVINTSPTTSKKVVSRKRRTEIEIPMEVPEVTFSFSAPKNDDLAKKRRTVCSTTNTQNIKRLNFTISPDTSSYQIKENLEQFYSRSPVKRTINNSLPTAKLFHKTTRDSLQKTNPVKKLNDTKVLDFNLLEVDEYLRRLQIRKLEKDLGLANVEYAAETSNDDVEMYYRRLQILKLETELNLQQSKYTEDFVE